MIGWAVSNLRLAIQDLRTLMSRATLIPDPDFKEPYLSKCDLRVSRPGEQTVIFEAQTQVRSFATAIEEFLSGCEQ